MRFFLIAVMVAVYAVVGYFALFSYFCSYEFRDSGSRRVVFDSPKVRGWLSSEWTRTNVDRRERMLHDMAAEPGAAIEGHAYCRILETSAVPCGSDAIVRILVTTGPLRGKNGWVCKGMDLAPSIAWP
jgi:hypothetical protein